MHPASNLRIITRLQDAALGVKSMPMRETSLFFLLAFGLLALLPLQAQQRNEIMDGIAAVVNSDIVTISQLRELTLSREMAMREIFSGEDLTREVAKMRESAIQDLIDRQLIIQEFRKREFSIPDHVINDRIQTIILQEFGGDRQAFIRTLQAQGYSLNRFRELEREKIIVQAMRQANTKQDFIITPKQVQAFYDRNKGSYTTPEEIRLRMIVLRDGPSDSLQDGDLPIQGDKRAMAQEIREKLINGADFARMAAMYSEDPTTAETGGDWGWIQRDTLNDQLTRAAFGLGSGQVSPVVQLGDSYYILLVEERKPARVKPMAEVKEQIEMNLLQEERAKAQERWLETLRQNAFIRILT
jgi:peptidyl-prolyl cis-trans isomerase SurA